MTEAQYFLAVLAVSLTCPNLAGRLKIYRVASVLAHTQIPRAY